MKIKIRYPFDERCEFIRKELAPYACKMEHMPILVEDACEWYEIEMNKLENRNKYLEIRNKELSPDKLKMIYIR